MAWYALYKWFIPWRKTPYTNWVDWYSNKLYNEWWNSLPKERREYLLKRQEERKLKEDLHMLKLLQTYGDILRRGNFL